MKLIQGQATSRISGSISYNYFVLIFRNFIMCVVLSIFMGLFVRDSIMSSFWYSLLFYSIVTVAFYVALLFGQLPSQLNFLRDESARAPRYYTSLHPVVKVLFWAAVFIVSFFAFYLFFHFKIDTIDHPEY